MRNLHIALAIALAASILAAASMGFLASMTRYPPGAVTFHTAQGPASLEVEIADEPQEQSRGLMYRDSLPDGYGMLFIFPDDSERSFWMKNTLIPLDIIFISSSLEVVRVTTAQPCPPSAECPIYRSGAPARYVVEASAGFASSHGIEQGSLVSVPPPTGP